MKKITAIASLIIVISLAGCTAKQSNKLNMDTNKDSTIKCNQDCQKSASTDLILNPVCVYYPENGNSEEYKHIFTNEDSDYFSRFEKRLKELEKEEDFLNIQQICKYNESTIGFSARSKKSEKWLVGGYKIIGDFVEGDKEYFAYEKLDNNIQISGFIDNGNKIILSSISEYYGIELKNYAFDIMEDKLLTIKDCEINNNAGDQTVFCSIDLLKN